MALIEVDNLYKIFHTGDEDIHALDGVSLRIESGEYVAITGPSGSGKSTMMHILGLLDRQSSGSYRLDGKLTEDLSDADRSRLRNQTIGFVFQNFHLLPRANALRNVAMPLVYSASYDRHYSRAKIVQMAGEALQRVSLTGRATHRPSELSGGQRQRVAIARAIVNHPRILFADEPTGNLDSRHGAEILGIFDELHREGVTIILVTHDATVATRAERVLKIVDGRISEDSGGRHAVA